MFGSNSTTFSYNTSRQRWKQDANYAGVHEITYYIGGIMEKVTKGSGPTEYRHLIPAGSGSAILTRRSDLTNSTYYTTSDHLGSGDFVLSSTGTVVVHESFTPFGARRGANWQGIPTTTDYTAFSSTTRRGFTGHEMLDSVGLVHMNGRVYDPLIGRFLSADPIIQTLALSQAINPFSYVMNNPLALIDPSGYSWLSKLFHSIGKIVLTALAIAALIISPAMLFVGMQVAIGGSVMMGLGFAAYGLGIGLIAANQLHLPAWANELIALTSAIITGGATIASIASTIKHHVEQYYIRRELERVLRKNGLSLAEIDAALEVLSIIGEQLPNKDGTLGRLQDLPDNNVLIKGMLQRHWYGIPFDVADVLLGYQGLPTGASWRYIVGGRIGRDIYDHSLGTLDGANLSGLGLSGKVTSYSVPIGNTQPLLRGSSVTLNPGDFVNGFGLGWILNPTATNSHGAWFTHGLCPPSKSGYGDAVVCPGF